MSGRIVARYDYTNVKGEPRIRKLRFDPKGFRMKSAYQAADGTWGYTTGINDERMLFSTRALYKLPEVVAALRVDVPVWWCEGEKDADSLVALGFSATSVWQGSDLYWNQAEWFIKYRSQSDVIVVCDNDLPGGWFGWERYRALIDLGVVASRIVVLAPPRPRKYNDVTDLLEAGGRPSDLRVVDLDLLRCAAERYGASRAARYTRDGPARPHQRGAP